MLDSDYIFLNSDNVWFGIPIDDVDAVKMNQKPGWFPKPDDHAAGIYLHEAGLFHILHLGHHFLGNFKTSEKVHVVILKKKFGNWAIAAQEVKTKIDLPKGETEKIKELAEEDYGTLLTHWFPVDLNLIKLPVMENER